MDDPLEGKPKKIKVFFLMAVPIRGGGGRGLAINKKKCGTFF